MSVVFCSLLLLSAADFDGLGVAEPSRWRSVDDTSWGGRSVVEAFSDEDCELPETLRDPEALEQMEMSTLPGCGQVVGRVDERLGLAVDVSDVRLEDTRSILLATDHREPIELCAVTRLDEPEPEFCTWPVPTRTPGWLLADYPRPLGDSPHWLTFTVGTAGPVVLEIEALAVADTELSLEESGGCAVVSSRPGAPGGALLLVFVLSCSVARRRPW